MLSFEGQQFQGVKTIVEKLCVSIELRRGISNVLFFQQSLPFQRVQHRVATVDAQPANPQLGSILVTVTGQLLVRISKVEAKNLSQLQG